MGYYYDPKTGKAHDMSNIGRVTVVDPKGNIVEDKSIERGTRGMLNLVNTAMASDYSYMPVTSKDMVHGLALNSMTDSGVFAVAKVLAPVIATAVTAGNPVAGGLAYLLAEAGTEIYQWADAMNEDGDPNKFWNKFIDNMDTVRKDDEKFNRYVGEMNIGLSRSLGGAKSSLYKSWGDLLGEEKAGYTAVNVIGNIVRSFAAPLAGAKLALNPLMPNALANSLIADTVLSDATRTFADEYGTTGNIDKAIKFGAINGIASGVTGVGFMRLLPYVTSQMPKIANMAQRGAFTSAAINAAEMAAYAETYDNIVRMSIGEEFKLDPMVAAPMAILGGAMGLITHRMNRPKIPIGNNPVEYTGSKELAIIPRRADYNKPLYETFGTDLSASQKREMAEKLVFSDQANGTRGDGSLSLVNRIKSEYMDFKGKHLRNETAEDVAKHYADYNPELSATYGRYQGNLPVSYTGENTLITEYKGANKRAVQVIAEGRQRLLRLGFATTPEEASFMAKQAYVQAKNQFRDKEIGGFEMQKIFNQFFGE